MFKVSVSVVNFSVSIVSFEQVNAGWVFAEFPPHSKYQMRSQKPTKHLR